jgi:hypothetical protein
MLLAQTRHQRTMPPAENAPASQASGNEGYAQDNVHHLTRIRRMEM